MHINWGKVNNILNFYTIKDAGCVVDNKVIGKE